MRQNASSPSSASIHRLAASCWECRDHAAASQTFTSGIFISYVVGSFGARGRCRPGSMRDRYPDWKYQPLFLFGRRVGAERELSMTWGAVICQVRTQLRELTALLAFHPATRPGLWLVSS